MYANIVQQQLNYLSASHMIPLPPCLLHPPAGCRMMFCSYLVAQIVSHMSDRSVSED